MNARTRTMTASEFKATCLDVLDQLAEGRLESVVVTKRGRPVGVVTPPQRTEKEIDGIFGCMRDETCIPPDLDLTAPVLDEPLDAELGVLHR